MEFAARPVYALAPVPSETTTMKQSLLRSALYMPGANQRAMDKARSLPCDAVIFDLEDAVAPDMKETARDQVLAQYAAGGYGERRLVIRANSIDSPWGEADLAALGAAGVTTVCLPKVDSADQLKRCIDALYQAGAPTGLQLWAMIETPHGVANVEAICAAADELEALLMGTTDLAHQLRTPRRADRLGLQYALGKCVNAGRMYGRTLLDSVCLDIADAEAFRADCEQGRALGFDGKTLIHPSQIDITNQVYGFSDEQIVHSRRVIAAWRAAEAEGKGVAVLDGKLVETMHVDEAQRILDLTDSRIETE
ncbi:MAG: CoA ester lyase [Halieaceae bacterium]